MELEATPEPTKDLNKLLSEWLAANGVTLVSRVVTPKGNESVSVDNFIPAGWTVAVVVIAKKP